MKSTPLYTRQGLKRMTKKAISTYEWTWCPTRSVNILLITKNWLCNAGDDVTILGIPIMHLSGSGDDNPKVDFHTSTWCPTIWTDYVTLAMPSQLIWQFWCADAIRDIFLVRYRFNSWRYSRPISCKMVLSTWHHTDPASVLLSVFNEPWVTVI